jgi:hypothetical protein
MKSTFLFLIAFMIAVTVVFTSSIVKTGIELSAPSAKRVSFKVKGIGSKNTAVTIGIYFQPE